MLRRFDDLDLMVHVEPGEYAAKFTVYEKVSEDDDDVWLYQAAKPGEPWFVANHQDAKPLLWGDVKWDGCSNWMLHPDGMMFHGCERSHLTRVGEVMARCWDMAAEVVGAWDGA